MSTDETVTYNIRYNLEGLDKAVRGNQRLLFFANALRLSIQDIKQLGEERTLSQLLWTTIQLTRAWTALHRIIKATNTEQKRAAAGAVVNSARGGGGGLLSGLLSTGAPATGVSAGLGLRSLFGEALSTPELIASALGIGVPALGLLLGGALFGVGLIALKSRNVKLQKDWRERQREIARAQGLEF